MNSRLKFLSIFILIAMMVGCSENQKPVEFKQLLVYPKKNLLGSFEIKSHDDNSFNRQSFEGKWNLIFIGYTHCPDVCPLTLTEITKFYQQIPQEIQKEFQIIFLSVDPKRDTLEHLAGYIEHFHSDFVAVTGEKEEIDKLVYSLGGIYSINNEDENYYSVDHSGRIFIVNPKGERFGIISSEAMHAKDKSSIAKELSLLPTLGK
ncbi:MAG: SCO family protein [Kangiellaceae bacterium]|nr:SCO family protein [Kangiellaceae bacterium]